MYNYGIDVGNNDTKSDFTSIPSGFVKSTILPAMASKYLFYGNKYYVPSETRFPYAMDKTKDDQCLMLTLMSLAEEIIHTAKKKNVEDIQKYIDNIKKINLGVGLPPAHLSHLGKKTKDYYLKKLGKEVQFEYNHYMFSFSVENCHVFPQDFVAAVSNKRSHIIKEYKTYYAIDIGGQTVDVVKIKDGEPDAENCASRELGTRKMYDKIVNHVLLETGITIDMFNVEDILLKKEHILPSEVVDIVNEQANAWTNKIFNELRQAGLEFKAYPCVFFGGGPKLLKPFIKKNNSVSVVDFIGDVHANAKGYTYFLNLIYG